MLFYFSIIIFFSAIFLTFYTYLLYPLILLIWSWLKSQDEKREEDSYHDFKTVTMVVAAYNEEKVIKNKIENISELDYPKNKMSAIIASDGSNDRTNEIVKQCEAVNISLLELPRMGKVNVLNHAVPITSGEIIVFSDANTLYNPKALKKLVNHFQDPEVGCVCGRLKLINPKDVQSGEAEGFYWRYETWIKKKESRLGCVVGANGAIYAIRKTLFEKMPSNVINDDFHISMKIMEKGYKVIYERNAIGIEEVAPDFKSEFLRHVRDGAGHYREMGHLRGLLNPMKGIRFFTYFSHRIIRWVVPFMLPLIFISNLAMAESPVYATLFVIQLLFYMMVFVTFFLQRHNISIRILNIPFFFITINLALLIGFLRNLFGTQTVSWDRTER